MCPSRDRSRFNETVWSGSPCHTNLIDDRRTAVFGRRIEQRRIYQHVLFIILDLGFLRDLLQTSVVSGSSGVKTRCSHATPLPVFEIEENHSLLAPLQVVLLYISSTLLSAPHRTPEHPRIGPSFLRTRCCQATPLQMFEIEENHTLFAPLQVVLLYISSTLLLTPYRTLTCCSKFYSLQT